MSQAENRNTTIPTRRALLAGAPAVAAAALAGATAINAVAIAEAKAAEVDPIFAIIERHGAALDHLQAARQRLKAMDKLYPREAFPAEWPSWSIEQRAAWNRSKSLVVNSLV
jgi:hypothetical protein